MKTLGLMASGAVVGYMAGVFVDMGVECSGLREHPSNLCGLIALMYYGPIASVIGVVGGFILSLLWTPKSS
jgi:hypothetical protein